VVNAMVPTMAATTTTGGAALRCDPVPADVAKRAKMDKANAHKRTNREKKKNETGLTAAHGARQYSEKPASKAKRCV
jgi:hypothetical protein